MTDDKLVNEGLDAIAEKLAQKIVDNMNSRGFHPGLGGFGESEYDCTGSSFGCGQYGHCGVTHGCAGDFSCQSFTG